VGFDQIDVDVAADAIEKTQVEERIRRPTVGSRLLDAVRIEFKSCHDALLVHQLPSGTPHQRCILPPLPLATERQRGAEDVSEPMRYGKWRKVGWRLSTRRT
jgi:hypothetical protein